MLFVNNTTYGLAPNSQVTNNQFYPATMFTNAIGLSSFLSEDSISGATLEVLPYETPDSISLKKLTIHKDSRNQKHPQTNMPIGLSILPFELSSKDFPAHEYHLLYRDNRLIAIFPVLPDSFDKEKSYNYFDLSYFHFDILSLKKMPSGQAKKRWLQFARQFQKDQKAINQFINGSRTRSKYFKKKPHQSKPRYRILVEEKTPYASRFKVISFEPDDILTDPSLLDEILKPSTESERRITIPVFHTVYAPGDHKKHARDDEFLYDESWYRNLKNALDHHLKTIPGHPLNPLIIGPGSGIDSWMTSQFQPQQLGKLRIVGINPFEVQNTALTLELAGVDYEVELGNNIYNDWTGKHAFEDEVIHVIIWNMPAYNQSMATTTPKKYTHVHDNHGGVVAMQNLVLGLQKRYSEAHGEPVIAILWNEPNPETIETPDKRILDPIEDHFEKIGWKLIDTNSDAINFTGNYYVFRPGWQLNKPNQGGQDILKAA